PGRAGLSAEGEASFQREVVGRAQAEQAVSLGAVVREMFEDMHFVYAGMGAIAAGVVCAIVMLGMMRAVTRSAIDPLLGSNQNPLLLGSELQLPRVIGEDGFASSPGLTDDVVFA